MADFNSLVASELAEGARRLFGEDLVLSSVSPELGLHVIAKNDRIEHQALFNETAWSHGSAVGPSVANFSSLSIGSGQGDRITVVTALLISNDQAGAQAYRVGETLGLGADITAVGAVRDLRRRNVSTILTKRNQAADVLPSLPPILVPANSTLFLPVEWPIPGSSPLGVTPKLTVQGNIVNTSVTVYFWGYERKLRPEELILD